MRIYLACPYSNADPAIEAARFDAANLAAGRLMKHGDLVFSPISHSHPIHLAHELPGDFAFWQAFDEWQIGACEAVVVLMIDGWRESKGIKAEVALARSQGKNVWGMTEDGEVVPLPDPQAAHVAGEP
ncbi:MAG: DUF1937 family protein [Brevundimonas sp.]